MNVNYKNRRNVSGSAGGATGHPSTTPSLHHSGSTPPAPLPRRNLNRGYQQLRVWQDAIDLYRLTCETFQNWPFERKKIVSQAIASADSVHRNIAEGYCRRTIREYLQALNISLGSLGESVSGYFAYQRAGQITPEQFEMLDALAFRLENGMLRLVESLERKRDEGSWTEAVVLRESNEVYGSEAKNWIAGETE
ncbi:MAG: four helix bundle protein [Verrucomicrobia bacterium]|nr:four helix bundle protein [Verrucomicrobiota bacterium]